MRSWRVTHSETLFQHRLFALRRESLVAESTEEGGFAPAAAGATREALTLDAPTWVNVIALLPGDRVLLVRQWRYGIGAPTLEIPGGMVEVGPDPDRVLTDDRAPVEWMTDRMIFGEAS